MTKKTKKSLIAALSLSAVATFFAACDGAGMPNSNDFDSEYQTTIAAKSDAHMDIDGQLLEDAWEDKTWFVNYLAEDETSTRQHVELTTYATQKGFYLAAKIFDTAIYDDGNIAPRNNSTLHLAIALPTDKSTGDIRRLYLDAKTVVSSTNNKLFACEYAVKVDGTINESTTGMTMELFMPWHALNMETPANPEAQEVRLMPYYNVAANGSLGRLLQPLPNNASSIVDFFSFNGSVGFMEDLGSDLVGNAKNGTTKLGDWKLIDVAKNPATSNENTIALLGQLKTERLEGGQTARLHLSDICASNLIMTTKITPIGNNGSAGIELLLANGASKRILVGFGPGLTQGATFTSIRAYLARIDYYNAAATDQKRYMEVGEGEGEGLTLTVIKNAQNYYYYVNETLIYTEMDTQAKANAYPAVFSSDANVVFSDVSCSYFDTQAAFDAAIAQMGIAKVSVGIDYESTGFGNVSLQGIAVDVNDPRQKVTVSAVSGNGSYVSKVFKETASGKVEITQDFFATAYSFGKELRGDVYGIDADTRILVCFDEFNGVAFSGRISALNAPNEDFANTQIYAYKSDGNVIPYVNCVQQNGEYTIMLPDGQYDKICFRSTNFENMFSTSGGSPIVVNGAAQTGHNFVLTTKIPVITHFGGFRYNWTYTGDREYVVQPQANSGDAYTMATLGNADTFTLDMRVRSEKMAEVGVNLQVGFSYDLRVIAIPASSAIGLYSWQTQGWVLMKGVPEEHFANKTDYAFRVARVKGTLAVWVNDYLAYYGGGDIGGYAMHNLEKLGATNVGLCLRGVEDAVIYNYTYTEEINEQLMKPVTMESWESSLGTMEVGGIINGKAPIGSPVRFYVTPAANKMVVIKANGETVSSRYRPDGTYEYAYTMPNESVHFTFEAYTVYEVSGTVAGFSNGNVTAVNVATGEKYVFERALKGGAYLIRLVPGTYDVKFEGSAKNGMLQGVVVTNANLTNVNLTSSYQNVRLENQGTKAYTFEMTGNGEYTIYGNGAPGNAFTVGVLGTATNFLVETYMSSETLGQMGISFYTTSGVDDIQIFYNSGAISLYSWNNAWSWIGSYAFDAAAFAANKGGKLSVAKYEGALYVWVDDQLVVVRGTAQSGPNFAQIQNVNVGFSLRGDSVATFLGYSFTDDNAAIEERLSEYQCQVTGLDSWNTADGTLKVDGLTGGIAYHGGVVVLTISDTNGLTPVVKVNGNAISPEKNNGKFIFSIAVTGDVAITFQMVQSAVVSGTTADITSGYIEAIDLVENTKVAYEKAIQNGVYEIELALGKYMLVFVGASKVGVIEELSVSGDVSNANLASTFLKVSGENQGTTAYSYAITGDGEYTITHSEPNGNAFTVGVVGAAREFVFNVSVTAEQLGQVGVTLFNAGGADDIQIFYNGDTFAFYSWYWGWIEWASFNNTDFLANKGGTITVARHENSLYLLVDGVLLYAIDGSMGANKPNFADIGATKVGFSVRGASSATFYDYSFSTSEADILAAIDDYKVNVTGLDSWNTADGALTHTGIENGNASYVGKIICLTVTPAQGVSLKVKANGVELAAQDMGDGSFAYTYTVVGVDVAFTFDAAILYSVTGTVTGYTSGTVTAKEISKGASFVATIGTDGAFTLKIPNGTYDLTFDLGTHEGVIAGVEVADQNVSGLALQKAYQKLTVTSFGVDAQNATWKMTGNGEYTVTTAVEGGDAITMAYFASVADMSKETFAIETKITVEKASALMIGFAMQGDKGGVSTTAVWAINSGDNSAQIRWMSSVGGDWPGHRGNALANEGLSYTLRVEKIGDMLTYYVNGNKYCVWIAADYDFNAFKNAKIGFGFYRMYNVKFNEYKYVTSNISPVEHVISEGAAASWRVLDDGSIKAETAGVSGNDINFLSLATLASWSASNFTINATISVAHEQALFIGLVAQGTNASGANKKFIYGLNNANNTAQAYLYTDAKWDYGYAAGGTTYTRSSYKLRIAKTGDVISIRVNNRSYASFDVSTLEIASYKNVKVGLGIYRSFDATFSDVSITIS